LNGHKFYGKLFGSIKLKITNDERSSTERVLLLVIKSGGIGVMCMLLKNFENTEYY